jgi:hypothetical protein
MCLNPAIIEMGPSKLSLLRPESVMAQCTNFGTAAHLEIKSL